MAWTFTNLRYGGERSDDLALSWEAASDFITDDYTPDEIDAADLLQQWLSVVASLDPAGDLGPEWVPIVWAVSGRSTGTYESAPFAIKHYAPQDSPDFLTYYSWPRDDQGERLNWLTLPVEDKLWRPGRGDKGGFIQEVTGWKPAPLQPYLHVSMFNALP